MRLSGNAGFAALLLLTSGWAACAQDKPDLGRLEGAWVPEGTACKAVFYRQGSAVHFARPGAAKRDGVVIKGNRIEDARNRCTIRRAKEEASQYTVLLSCFSGLLVSSFALKLRFAGEDTVIRTLPDFPDEEKRWQRCRP